MAAADETLGAAKQGRRVEDEKEKGKAIIIIKKKKKRKRKWEKI